MPRVAKKKIKEYNEGISQVRSERMNKKIFFTVFAITLAVLLVVVGLMFFGMIKPAFTDMNQDALNEELEAVLQKPGKDGFNILLLGTDAGGRRTDTIMLVSFNKKTGEIATSSIPRDTRVKIGKNHQKINSALPIGGLDMLIEAVSEVTGAPIHYYAKVNFEGFRNVVDILGGVEFDVPQDMHYEDPAQDLYIDLKKGVQLLNGDRAEQLCRYRRYPEADVARTRVQQQFIKAMIEQKMKPSNVFKLPAVMKEVGTQVASNFTFEDFCGILPSLLKVKGDKIVSYPMPGGGKTIGGASYFLPASEGVYELYTEHFFGTGAPEKKKYTNITRG